MSRRAEPAFIVHCALSHLAVGNADAGRIIDTRVAYGSHSTSESLIDGDHLALRLSVPEHCRPISVRLAKVNWVQGNRFEVQLLMMDADERLRLSQFFDQLSPLELESRESRSALIITAVE